MNLVTVKIGEKEMVFVLNERGEKNPFSSGSVGFHGQGKMQVGEKVFQCNFLLVEVGSKGKYKK